MKKKQLLVLASLALLASCGGPSSSSEATSTVESSSATSSSLSSQASSSQTQSVVSSSSSGVTSSSSEVNYGSAVAVVKLYDGLTEVTAYEGISCVVNADEVIVAVEGNVVTLTNLIPEKLYSVTFSKEGYADVSVKVSASEGEEVRIGGESGITLRTTNNIVMTYTVPNAKGHRVTIYDENGEKIKDAVVGDDDSFTVDGFQLENYYYASINVMNVESNLVPLDVNGDGEAGIDFSSEFRGTSMIGDKITYDGKDPNCEYSMNVNVNGDFYFATKFKIDLSKFPETIEEGHENDEIRFGMLTRYESASASQANQSLTFHFKKSDKGWTLQQLNSWWNKQVPDEMIQAMAGDGVYIIEHRDAKTGFTDAYWGASKDDIKPFGYTWNKPEYVETSKGTLIGIGFNGWTGPDYLPYSIEATEMRLGSTLREALDMENADPVSMVYEVPGYAGKTISIYDGNKEFLRDVVVSTEETIALDGLNLYEDYYASVNIWGRQSSLAAFQANGLGRAKLEFAGATSGQMPQEVMTYTSVGATANFNSYVYFDPIETDFYFAAKIKSTFVTEPTGDSDVRLCMQIAFEGGQTGFSLHFREAEGRWAVQDMTKWWKANFSDEIAANLAGDGLYFVIGRHVDTGLVDAYVGADKNNLTLLEATHWQQADLIERHKTDVKGVGLTIYKDARPGVNAEYSEINTGTTLAEALNIVNE